MKKCELCKCVISDDIATLLPYSKGDYFCSDCLTIIKGVRRCVICDDEFYYSTKGYFKLTCRSLFCINKFAMIKHKIKKGYFLNEKEMDIAIREKLL